MKFVKCQIKFSKLSQQINKKKYIQTYLQNSVVAKCQQRVLLQLIVLRKPLHRVKRQVGAFSQKLRMNVFGEFGPRQVVHASGGRYLHAELVGMRGHCQQHQLEYVGPGFLEAAGELEQVVESLLHVRRLFVVTFQGHFDLCLTADASDDELVVKAGV